MKYRNYPKAYNFKRLDSESFGQRILKNSLTFLSDGIQQIESNTSQSIVNFWIGVELFIKSILVEEHWSLIVKDTSRVNHKDFENGDFVSIDFAHSIKLLENVFDIALEKRTKRAFDIIRKHRNRIVHFANLQIENRNALEVCDIFIEMSNVWNELQGLSLPVLDFDENEIPALYDNISELIDNHKVILQGKFQHAYETKLRHLNNDEVLICRSCNYKAVILSAVNRILSEAKCLVCNDVTDVLKVECGHCNRLNYLHKSEHFCINCNTQLNLMSDIFAKGADDSKNEIAACHRCGSKSVVNIDGIWFCLNCFSYHTVAICDRCGAAVTHSTENSIIDGCICCED